MNIGKYGPTDARKSPSDFPIVINFGKRSNISNHGVLEGLTILFRGHLPNSDDFGRWNMDFQEAKSSLFLEGWIFPQ